MDTQNDGPWKRRWLRPQIWTFLGIYVKLLGCKFPKTWDIFVATVKDAWKKTSKQKSLLPFFNGNESQSHGIQIRNNKIIKKTNIWRNMLYPGSNHSLATCLKRSETTSFSLFKKIDRAWPPKEFLNHLRYNTIGSFQGQTVKFQEVPGTKYLLPFRIQMFPQKSSNHWHLQGKGVTFFPPMSNPSPESSWCFFPTHLKNMLVKLDHFPM